MTATQFDSRSIDRYQCEVMLREDWLGVCYQATNLNNGEPVYLRLVAPLLARDPSLLAALRSAPERLHGLRHANILPTLASGVAEGQPWLASPYVKGETLAERLAKGKRPWPLSEATPVLRPVAQAVDAAHAAGIVHGALSPSSILLADDGRVLVGDFGLLWSPEPDSGLLQTVAHPDLLPVMASEVLAYGQYGAAGDRYALAAVAYRLLTGRWPYIGDDPGDLLASQLEAGPVDPLAIVPELSRTAGDALLRGLHADPAQRWNSAAAFVDALAAGVERPWQQAGLAFVDVPAGPFTFGEGASARLVNLPEFQIGIYPVTNAQFAVFTEAAGYFTQAEREGWGLAFDGARWRQVKGACWRAPGGPGTSVADKGDHPVVQITLHDAQAFCAWADVGLPNEQQWEKTARGADARLFPWGDRWRPELCRHAGSPVSGPAPVAGFPSDASPYGVRALAGNVWEWTASPYDLAGAYQVLRGGAWPHDQRFLTTTFRYYALPGYRCDALGFRCIREE